MIKRVLIQEVDAGGTWSVNGDVARRGFDQRGFELGTFTFAELRAGRVEVDPTTMLVGGAGAVMTALGRLGVTMPAIDDLPEPLAFLRGRRVWTSTLAQVQADVDRRSTPVFVKPLRDPKAFAGRVVAAFRDVIPTAHLPNAMPVLVSEVVTFVAEWRFFVHRGRAIGAGCYRGDPLAFPDPSRVTAAIDAWGAAAPVGYAIDLGVTDNGRTLLVEVNDGFSLGCLGLRPTAYSLLLQDRWVELVRSARPGG